MKYCYILACDGVANGGGIYKYALSPTGMEKVAFFPCDRPMYTVREGDFLRVIVRQPNPDNINGGYFSLDLQLENPTEIQYTDGVVPCHLCVDGDDCYTVNYLSGNIVRVGKKIVTHRGKGSNPVRQDMPHTHFSAFTPDKKYIICCDLGLDTLFCYDRALHLLSSAKIADGYGIRHAVFSKDGKYIYAISEMIPALHIFSYEEGKVEFLTKYEIPCEKEKGDGAAIRLSPDGSKIYCSLRVENALVTFAVKGEKAELIQKVACGGDSPRDFWVTEERLIVTNEKSDDVVVFAIEQGTIEGEVGRIKVPKPLCCIVE